MPITRSMFRPTIRAATGFECEPGRVTTANLPPHPNKCGQAQPSLYGEEELGQKKLSLGRDFIEGHIRWNVVARHYIPHALFHAHDFVPVVGMTILQPARVVAVELLLVLGR